MKNKALIIEKEVKPFGNSAHVIVSKKLIGKRVMFFVKANGKKPEKS